MSSLNQFSRPSNILNQNITPQHSTEVENALYSDDRILDAAAVSVPDKRLGELVAAVVTTKSHFHGQVTEADVIKRAREQ